MRPEKPNDDLPTDLEWLAFCYISDELDETAREQFEARLATDQTAREFVADAMEQTQLLYAALAPQNPPVESLARKSLDASRSKTRFRISETRLSTWVASAAAVCLMSALGWLMFNRMENDKLERSVIAKADHKHDSNTTAIETGTGKNHDFGNVDIGVDSLAVAWANVFSESETIKTSDFLTGDEPESAFTNVLFDGEAWLYEAVVQLDSESSSNQPAQSGVPDTEPKKLNGGI